MEIDESKYIKGFNAGYFLSKYEPKVSLELLEHIHPINSYISGMNFGQKEFQIEIDKNQLEELKSIRHQKDNSRNLE
ncbi:MAG: hypothetical protein IPK88_20290 [Saprospiraceae bacterium]|nr:hypothetical protein [Candidatus Defluviibacterium haderslevense]MBK8245775.1 hypothetical protein [Candidatus Defluviibacterium haderslevense]